MSLVQYILRTNYLIRRHLCIPASFFVMRLVCNSKIEDESRTILVLIQNDSHHWSWCVFLTIIDKIVR